MIDDGTRSSLEDLLRVAEERFTASSTQTLISGYQLEAAQTLARAQRVVDTLLAHDPTAYVEYQKRIDDVWSAFVAETNLSGLGEVAAMIGRNR